MKITKLLGEFAKFINPTILERDRKASKRKLSKFFGIKERDENNNLYIYRAFNKPQLIGKLIRANKKVMYRIIGLVDGDRDYTYELKEIRRR